MSGLSPSWHDLNPWPPPEHDDCPDCGETLGPNPRQHRCEAKP